MSAKVRHCFAGLPLEERARCDLRPFAHFEKRYADCVGSVFNFQGAVYFHKPTMAHPAHHVKRIFYPIGAFYLLT